MKGRKTHISDEYWNAIIECDPTYDNLFFYGVQTTGIFCRPSCKSKVPNKENVRIFKNAYIALAEQFRPCKRCKPDGLYFPIEEWIEQIVAWIDQHYYESITLQTLADLFHGSPYHLQRLFKRVKGQSPTEYLQQVRLEKAIHQLVTTNQSIANIGTSVGFSSTPYFTALFKKKTGTTPSSYRKSFLET
ncbi:bifunctional transcriptional activator/DNA repair enzyme AdaA [Hazenella coriacea]|uniref:AraC family transcriptional regulator of adaptative response / methylphosphotriester-DNA alkyltransferase methyltransferase n=1 Tax=Hazenella coriacea TaxID=1179467 RepID=A0A4R3LC31_9BACL|nr:bifunctional transcriptional activator/DNA repair enzyme AdaA [Hazenella coriacea]TCS96805.1 AraC family transcriptional regulator of adaptative response / methylphosphotriester-DNA alkyltransferase methyltransferase [Hazenella coriacea]